MSIKSNPEREVRVKTLTEKGDALYDYHRDRHTNKIYDLWCEVKNCIDTIQTIPKTRQNLAFLLDDIKFHYERYAKAIDEFYEFLSRKNTEDSIQLLSVRKTNDNDNINEYEQACSNLTKLISECAHVKSGSVHGSQKSAKSSRSSVAEATAIKRAELVGSKIRLKYVKKEIELKQQRDQVDNQLELLKKERDIIACEAELEVLDENRSVSPIGSCDKDIPSATEKVNAYLRGLKDININVPLNHENIEHNSQDQRLNPQAKQFVPMNNPSPDIQPESKRETTDFTRYLLKKDLLLSCLTKFNDKPESYNTWKVSFRSVMIDLKVTSREETDLILKYAGPESSKQVLSIKTANVNFPDRAVTRIWERLDERYGAPELVLSSLNQRLSNFQKINTKDLRRLYDLCDIISEIEAVKEDPKYQALLGHFDSSTGVSPIIAKLPHNLQERWTTMAIKYNKMHHVTFPPFAYFAEYLREQSKNKNNPCFIYETQFTPTSYTPGVRKVSPQVVAKKTDLVATDTAISVNSSNHEKQTSLCPIHNNAKHSLNECRTFTRRSIEERKQFLLENGMCFRCLSNSGHLARDCKVKGIVCAICGNRSHCTALHHDNPSNYGGEPRIERTYYKTQKSDNYKTQKLVSNETQKLNNSYSDTDVNTKCTQLCDGSPGRSCAKTVLAKVHRSDIPEKEILVYAIIDDQSNRSLATSEFFEIFNEQTKDQEYVLSSCGGQYTTTGRRATGYVIESIDGLAQMSLPTLIECNEIPNERSEIPTSEIAMQHEHLQSIASEIPPLNNDAKIMLLIGRDLLEAHHMLEQVTVKNKPKEPFAVKLNLGWVIIGRVCLDNEHEPQIVNVNKTQILSNGRASLFTPCQNMFQIDENREDIFRRSKDDDKPGLSIDDKEFINIMDKKMHKNMNGNFEAPLPLRTDRNPLPNNKTEAMKRAKSLTAGLQRNTQKQEHFNQFMQNIIDKGHAEVAPVISETSERWYLPIFGVYHPKKPDRIRVVFDSSAKCNGVSLNDVLLTGPDLTNSLLGILLRFRKENVAIMADIQQMFHCFYVSEKDRDFLRFLWHQDNDLKKDLIEYRMCVHTFGNSPSPAIASYGLRKAAFIGIEEFGQDMYDFVQNNFYVDDGLLSQPDAASAIDILKRTQQALVKGGNLRLHKISSNNKEVMESFPTEDLAQDVKDLNLGVDTPPLQRSLGIYWDITNDEFTYRVSSDTKPFTKRGVLSTINSLYDPLGFLAPIIVQGKLILRKLMSSQLDWDDPLPREHYEEWESWRLSLNELKNLRIPRAYVHSLGAKPTKELHIFSDASNEAIAACVYLRTSDCGGQIETAFVLGKAKVAPLKGHTIPRLELCAAVLAVQLMETTIENLNIDIDHVKLYSDSKVVLGYICNSKRRFYIYVANRVEQIRKSTNPLQWSYISTDLNPADQGTRLISTTKIQNSSWLQAPAFLKEKDSTVEPCDYELIDESADKEIRPVASVLKTGVTDSRNSLLGTHRFERFSVWRNLIRTVSYLSHISLSFRKNTSINSCKGWHHCSAYKTVDLFHAAEKLVIKEVQMECYNKEIQCIQQGRQILSSSNIVSLSPILDNEGILRVGGRLNKLNETIVKENRNPIIIPGRHHVATLLVRKIHSEIQHQGRHLTEGAVRAAGYWIVGGKRVISSMIYHCVLCRKLRGTTETQKMADLPTARLRPAPPFTYVGVDTFGPWLIVSRKTRGGLAHSKRWAVLFTCLGSRAVHIELVEDMSSSAFINAFRRFLAIRGEVKEIYSDRGTNFVGSTHDLKIDTINIEDGPVKEFLYHRGVIWKFNSPHSSHMGGVWERMIGVSRRILDAMLLNNKNKNLTHEVLSTLMYEVTAIINNRPIVSVSTDSETPEILTPSVLMTQKKNNDQGLFENLDIRDMYRSQWKQVQVLANLFWERWQKEYLNTIQTRTKWAQQRENLKIGDVVLLKDKNMSRNQWSVGKIVNVFPSEDNLVRKVEVRTVKNDKLTTYTRPITEIVFLLSQ